MEQLGNFPFFASFFAGILTFISPCVLPLIPAFLSFITGASLNDLKESKASVRQTFLKTLVFVSGFSAVFIILGMSASWLGGLVGSHKDVLSYIGGAAVIIFGLHLIGVFRIGFLDRQASANGKLSSAAGWFGTFLVGAAFALGWTPCVGPILSSILLLASTQGSVMTGFWLLVFYSAGIAVPFLLASLFINWFLKAFNSIKKYYGLIEKISGIFLIAVGILIITGGMEKMTIFAMKIFG
ncbi:MAG: cytochrome c biogenesis protein CcdA [Endomicrobia bacterium]|nr:cytochrome c biogenesis protein CcdA [Endomicrobiia bacterium]